MSTPDLYLGEGNTPVLQLSKLAKKWGLRSLLAKAEFLNPTGSYKDRIAAESMRVALANNCRGWLGTSSGNGGAAMSAYGARADLPGVLCVLEDAPAEKLGSIAPYGVLMLSMPTIGPEIMRKLAEFAQQESLFLTITAHAHNPEGMKGANQIGVEIAQHGQATHVYVPTGGGGLLASTGMGLAEIGSNALLIGAQPEGCAPIASYLNGALTAPRQDSWQTRISGLQLPEPPDGDLASGIVRQRGGWGVLVPDELAWRIQLELAQLEGLFVEPASALALAAVYLDVQAGRLGAKDEPCVVLTGHGLKDMSRFQTAPFRPQAIHIETLPDFARNWLSTRAELERSTSL